MSEQPDTGDRPVGKRGEAAWKEERDRIAQRNEQARKAGRQRQGAKDRLRAQQRVLAERREMAEAVGQHRGGR